jgi:hypothetical protein
MDRLAVLANIMSKLFYLALLGFVAIILVGPVLGIIAAIISVAFSVIATILPFALLGLLIWVIISFFTNGHRKTWHEIRHASESTYRSTLKRPMVHCARACRGTWHAGHAVWSRFRPGERCRKAQHVCAETAAACAETAAATVSTVRRGTHRAVEVAIEVLSGALIGTLVGLFWTWQTRQPATAGLIGAGIGAAVGIFVAVSRRLG